MEDNNFKHISVNKMRNYVQRGEIESAMKLAEAYNRIRPGDIEVLGILVEGALKKGDSLCAANFAKKIVEIDPQNAWGYYLLARCYRAMGETSNALTETRKLELFRAAQETIERSLQLDPDNPWTKIEAALIYLTNRNKTKGLELIKEARTLLPDDIEAKQIEDKIEAAE